MLTEVNLAVSYEKGIFPQENGVFTNLFRAHGCEVRGRPFALNFKRFHQMEFEGRLGWFVARDRNDKPIGYSCHYWFRDLHFCDVVGIDDLWYVDPDWRRHGVGRQLKRLGHAWLKDAGAVTTTDTVRDRFRHPNLMAALGFEKWGIRWTKTL